MTETKKVFKDWDISDLKDFTDMGGLQKFEESRFHRTFFGFNKQPKGTMHNMIVYGADLDEYSMLIDMDVIRKTDFLITNKDGKTTFQFFDERSDMASVEREQAQPKVKAASGASAAECHDPP